MDLIGRPWSVFRRARFLVAALALSPGAALGQAGYVHALSGEVNLQHGGDRRVVKAGDTFLSGTTFRTSGDGHLVIKFEDGQIVAAQPNTTFRVERYRYDSRNPRSSTSAVVLLGGALRYVIGVIGSTDAEAVKIGTDALRILRGTDVTLLVDAEAAPGQTVAVNSGQAYVQTLPGTVVDTLSPYATLSVLVGTAQYTTKVRAGSPPLLAGPVSGAPAAVQAAVHSLFSTPLPSNRPVVVAAAARAAAAVDQAKAVVAATASAPGNARLRTAAESARLNARSAVEKANSQSALAFEMAIRAGYVAPISPASSERVQAVSAPVQPEPTLRFLGCTGSPC